MESSVYRDSILLEGMAFFGHTGFFDFEKAEGQPFLVDLTLYFQKLTATNTDLLDDTVDYGAVFEKVRSIVEERNFDLIERLAGVIIEEILQEFPVDAVEVTIRKPKAPIQGVFDSMAVRIYRERENAPGGIS